MRTVLPKEQWDYIKAEVKRRAGGRCEICGKRTAFTDAHECWEYDEENGVQKLKGIIAVCKDCHAVIHYGRTSLKGDPIRAEEQYMKVNGATYAEFRAALKKANEEHIRRNRVAEWKLDLSYLLEFCNEGETYGHN